MPEVLMMPPPDSPSSLDYPGKNAQVYGGFLLPVLATISALSFMAAASASIGVWKDVSVMKESLGALIKSNDAQQRRYEDIFRQVQNHEVRLVKGKL